MPKTSPNDPGIKIKNRKKINWPLGTDKDQRGERLTAEKLHTDLYKTPRYANNSVITQNT